jgi:glycosyltransferase involved in cell wall biosynthesis
VPIVLTVHDLCFKENPNWFGFKTRLAFQFFFQRSLKMADAIICVSEYTKKQLLNYYGIDSRKIKVIYEAADDCFHYLNNRLVLKKKLKLKYHLDQPYFLIVGNVEERKQPRLIINAFKKVSKQYPNVKLVFAGPNKLKLIASKNIMFLGYVTNEDLNLLYNGATALIYFSLCEGFGLPLVEAIACRTPIICSNIPVFREVAGSAGFYVKNEIDLYRAMQKMLMNKVLREKYISLARKRSRLYSWRRVAKQTLFVYQNLA